MTKNAVIGLDVAQEILGRALRKRMGRGCEHSVQAVHEATFIPHSNLKAYRRGEATPSFHFLLRLVGYFGPAFLNEITEVIGLGGAHELHGDGNTLWLNAELNRVAALIAEHLKDGRVDHKELAEQVEAFRRLHVLIGPVIAQNNAAGKQGPRLAVAR